MRTLLFQESPIIVFAVLFFTILVAFVGWKYMTILHSFIAILIGLATIIGFMWFYRDPQIKPISNSLVTAPSFGIITDIKNTADHKKHIKIFLRLQDVHLQYAPIDGYLIRKFVEKGKIRHIFATKIGPVEVIQKAGYLVREPVSWISVGRYVKKGDKIGMIKFGSRVELILPTLRTKVKKGDYLQGPLTSI